MQIFMNCLQGTPWWIYLILATLLYMGYKSLSPQRIHRAWMFLLPIGFSAWILSNGSGRIYGIREVLLFFLLLALGTAIGWKLGKLRIKHIEGNIVSLPGSPLTLILVLAMFASRYYFGYQYAVYPAMKSDSIMLGWDYAIAGLIIGIFLGPALYCLRRKG